MSKKLDAKKERSLKRKRQREELRRNHLNQSFEELEGTMLRVDPSIRTNTSGSASVRSTQTSLPNRPALLNHACMLLEKLHSQNESMRKRLKTCEMTSPPPVNETKTNNSISIVLEDSKPPAIVKDKVTTTNGYASGHVIGEMSAAPSSFLAQGTHHQPTREPALALAPPLNHHQRATMTRSTTTTPAASIGRGMFLPENHLQLQALAAIATRPRSVSVPTPLPASNYASAAALSLLGSGLLPAASPRVTAGGLLSATGAAQSGITVARNNLGIANNINDADLLLSLYSAYNPVHAPGLIGAPQSNLTSSPFQSPLLPTGGTNDFLFPGKVILDGNRANLPFAPERSQKDPE